MVAENLNHSHENLDTFQFISFHHLSFISKSLTVDTRTIIDVSLPKPIDISPKEQFLTANA